MTEAGSDRLAAALAASDWYAIGRALRHDIVVIPLLVGEGGPTRLRVFPRDDGPVLGVFSSTETLRAAFPTEPGVRFAVQMGADLKTFLERYRYTLAHVVFDSAGPHHLQATVGDVIASLEPQPDDDPIAWVTGDAG